MVEVLVEAERVEVGWEEAEMAEAETAAAEMVVA